MYISKSIGKPKILRNSASLSAMYLSSLPLVEDIRRSADTRLSSPQCWPFVSARTQMERVFHPLVLDRVACRLLSYVYMVVNNVLNLPGNSPGWWCRISSRGDGPLLPGSEVILVARKGSQKFFIQLKVEVWHVIIVRPLILWNLQCFNWFSSLHMIQLRDTSTTS